MTRKEQNKILDAKVESNVNQYKVDRMNAEISAFSSGDLNKYEFLKRIDLNYKPNALDKARFEFSPLGKTFSTGLDKNAQGYQEEGVIKLLKDIRDGLRGVNRRPNDEFDNRPDDGLDYRSDDGSFDDDSSFDDDGSFDDNDNGSDLNKKYNSLLLKHFQLRKNMNDTSEELKDELDKTKDELDKTKMNYVRILMIYMILMILMKMVFIKILVSIMILMVLIAMVFIQELMTNMIIMVLI